MTRSNLMRSAVVALSVAAAACSPNGTKGTTANARDDAGTTPRAEDQLKDRQETDRWINDITVANLAEVELGKMAEARAANAGVKAFAQMMVKDHTEANQELGQIASRLDVTPPQQIDEKHRELADKLSKLKGVEFDREYAAAMVDGHQEVLDKLRTRTNMAARETPPEGVQRSTAPPHELALTDWAVKTLPKVQEHLDQAKQLKERVDNQRVSK